MKILETLKILFRKGLFHIFGASIINNIIQFVLSIVIVNLVSKEDYGIYVYAFNIISFFLLIRSLGITTGMLQFGSECVDKKERAEVIKYSFLSSTIVNIFITCILLLVVIVIKLEFEEAKYYIFLMILYPFFQGLFDFFSTIFRIEMNNISYSRITNVNTVAFFAFSIVLATNFGVLGIIFARYLSYGVSVILAIYLMKDTFCDYMNADIKNYKNKKSIVSYSVICCASNSISEMLYLLDVFLIGIFISQAEIIASYKVATQIPTALIFIPSCIMLFIYPYFAKNKDNIQWLKKNTFRTLVALGILNFIISVSLFIAAPLIINILWGNKYIDALPVLRILAINYFISGTFRIPCGNILGMLRKVNINLIISIVSGICNIFLDIILISNFGSIGAAIATVMVVIISSMISFIYLIYHLRFRKKGV